MKKQGNVDGLFDFFCPTDDDEDEVKERVTMPKTENRRVCSPINFSKFKDSKYKNSHYVDVNFLIKKYAEKICMDPEDNVSLETLIELLYVKFYGKRIAAYTRSIGDTELRLILARNLAIVGKGGEGSRIYEETRRSTKHVSDVLRNVRGVWNWYDSESEFAQRRNCRRRRDIEGDESHIYEIHSGDYFYKLIDGLSPNSDNLSYTTNRIISHNLLFGERTKFEFDGFALVDGKIRVVVKQKVIKPDFVSKDILENYVKDYFKRHFTSERYNLFGQSFLAFENDIFSISDLRQANVFVCDRKCYVIDCVIKLKDTSFFEKFDGVDRTDYRVSPLSGWWDGSPEPDFLVSFGDDYYNSYYNIHTRKSLSPHSWSIPNGARLNDNLVVATDSYKGFQFYTVGIKDDSERILYCIPKEGQDPHSPDYDFSGDWASDWDEMLYDHFDAIIEKREEEAKKRELSNKYHGYLANKTPLSAGKIDEYLSQLQRSNKDGSVVTRAQNIEYLVTLGIPQKREYQNYNSKKDKYVPYNYYGLFTSDTESYELTKSQYDYAIYLYDLKNTSLKSLQGKVKSLKNINMEEKHSNNMPLGNVEDELMNEIGYYADVATIPDPNKFDAVIYKGDKFSLHYDGDYYLDGDPMQIEKFYCGIRVQFGSNKQIVTPVLRTFWNNKHLCLLNPPARDFEESIPFDNCVSYYDKTIKEIKEKTNPNMYAYVSYLAYINDLNALHSLAASKLSDADLKKVNQRIKQLESGKTTSVIEMEKYQRRIDKNAVAPVASPFDFVGMEAIRPIMGTVFHDKGYQVASDAHVLIKYKTNYPKNMEGKMVPAEKFLKKFPQYKNWDDEVEGTYPNYEPVIPDYRKLQSVDVDVDKLYSYVANLVDYKKNYDTETYYIPLYAEGNRIGTFRGTLLMTALMGAKLIHANKFYFTDETRPFIFRNSKDDESGSIVLIMPVMTYGDETIEPGSRICIDIDYNRYCPSFDFGKVTTPYPEYAALRRLIKKTSWLITKNRVMRNIHEYPDVPLDGLGTLWGSVSDSDMYLDVSEWAHTTDIPAFALQLLNEVETILDSELHADTVVTGGVDKRRKIDDYGEKIYGARKDMLKEIAKSYDSLTKQVLISKTFSQVFKQPDVKTLLDSGVIRNSDAQFIYAVCQTMQTKPRGTSWSQKRAIEDWANRTMDKIVLIKSVLLTTTDEERDNIIKAATTVTEEEKALRVSVIQKLRELNKHLDEGRLKDFGAVESIKEMKIFDQVLTEINYTVGDKTEIPIKRIVPARTYDRYVLIDASNTEVMSAYSEKDAIDKIVSATFIANPYEGMQLPIKQMKICPDRNSAIKLPTGLWDYKAIECYPNSNLDRIYTTQDSDLFNNLKSWGDWLYDQDGDDSYMTETQAKKAFAEYKERYPRKKNVALCRMHERQNITGYSKYQIGVNDSKGNFKYITVDADSKDNAIAALELNYDSWNEQIVALLLEGKSKKASTFEDKFEVLDMTYSYRSRNNKERPFCVIYKPYVFKGCINRARVADFETKDAAKSWIKSEGQNFLKRLAERRKLEEPFFNRSGQRKGHDYRNGKDINEKTLAEKFGFRGIQFGNWANDKDRQAAVNNCYDALLDMCEILNLDPKAISLNGTLGMAFGARGTGSANAHYEPMETVINLTKTRGAGSLAHEWWHALDNHWSSTHHLYLTSDYIDGVRPQVSDAYKLLSKAIKESEYGKRCMSISGSYWGSMIEMTARLFQVYIDYKLREKENTSPFLERGFYLDVEIEYLDWNYRFYLSNQKKAGNKDVMSIEDFAKTDQALTGYVYTSQEDLKMFIPLIDNIFKTIHQTITENGNVKLSGIRRKQGWR